MKKVLALLVAILVVTFALASCTKGDSEATTVAEEPVESEAIESGAIESSAVNSGSIAGSDGIVDSDRIVDSDAIGG